MKNIFNFWHALFNCHKTLSISILFLLFGFSACDGSLGLPGNPVPQAEQAIEGQRKAMEKMTSLTKKDLIAKKRDVNILLDKAEPFLRRRANELEVTELILTLDEVKKTQAALRLYLDARTQPGKDTTTSEMNRALSQASDSINTAERYLNQYKDKHPETKE